MDLGPISIARFTGLFFFAITLLYFRKCYSVIPKPLWYFLGHLAIVAVLILFVPGNQSGFLSLVSTRIQLLIFFWAASNLLKDNRLARKALFAFAISAVLAGVAAQLGLAGLAIEQARNSRNIVLGLNSDILGALFAIAGVILVGLALENLRRIFLLGIVVVALGMIVVSGARASVVAFVLGAACYLLPIEFNFRKVIATVGTTIAMIMMAYMVMADPDFVARWNRTLNEGDSAGRDVLAARAWEMFLERPLIGWGTNEYGYELEQRYRGRRGEANSSHNLELDTLMESGILGGGLFFIGIGLCWASAWKNRRRELGMLRLAAVVTVLAVAQTVPYGGSKPLWLLLALCASTIRLRSKHSNQRTKGTTRPFSVSFVN